MLVAGQLAPEMPARARIVPDDSQYTQTRPGAHAAVLAASAREATQAASSRGMVWA